MLVRGGGCSYGAMPRIYWESRAPIASPRPEAKDKAATEPQIRTVQTATNATAVDNHSIPEDIANLKAEKIMANVVAFHETNPYDHTLVLKIKPNEWDALKDKYEDQVGFKMEYYAASDSMIVTWPSWVHENLDVLFHAFHKISDADPLGFRCLYNKDLRVMSEKKISNLTPDLHFARLNDSGEPDGSIIVECAVAQDAEALWKKAEDWVQAPHVQLVVAIKVWIEDGPTPSGPKGKTELTTKDLDESVLPTYGPIMIDGRIWRGKLQEILLRLYFLADEEQRAKGMEYEVLTFDITPSDDAGKKEALHKSLDEISYYLSSVTLDLVAESVFDRCFPAKGSFDLKWGDFYKSFARGLRLDALRRCNTYNKAPVPEPQVPKVNVSKRRLANQERIETVVKKSRID